MKQDAEEEDMSAETPARKSIAKATDQVLRVIRTAFGLRDRNAPKLPPAEALLLGRRAKLIVSATLVLVAAHMLLLREIGSAIDLLLKGTEPLPDLRRFIEGFSLVNLGAWGVAVLSACVAAYAWTLRRRHRLNLAFVCMPLIVGAAGVAFQPIALRACKARVRLAYDRGVQLFKEKRYEECKEFFDDFYELTKNTFIGDNALGRIAGSAFHRELYEDCLRACSTLLRRYPDSDIRASIIESARLAMEQVGAQADSARCKHLYADLELASVRLSPFYFCLESEQILKSSRLDDFGRMAFPLAELTSTMLGALPTDELEPKAAYFAGLRPALEARFRDSNEGRLYRIIRGDELVLLQRWDEALQEYSAYLDAGPSGAHRRDVLGRVVRLILGRHGDLDSILTATVELLGENSDYGTAGRDLLVGRLLYEPDTAALLAGYSKWSAKLSLETRAHLAAGIAERLELDGDSTASREYRSEASKLVAAARQVTEGVDTPWGLNLPSVAAGLERFCNRRLAAASDTNTLWETMGVVSEASALRRRNAALANDDESNGPPWYQNPTWLHRLDARYLREILNVRPPGAPSFTERLCRRLEGELQARAQAMNDPIKAIAMLADMRPSKSAPEGGLKTVRPINFVIDRCIEQLERTEWSDRTADEAIRQTAALLRIRSRVGDQKRVSAIAQRSLEECASTLSAGGRFTDLRAASDGVHACTVRLGSSEARQHVADQLLLQMARDPGTKLEDYVRDTAKLWAYCSKPALTKAHTAAYVASTASERSLTMAFVDRSFSAIDMLQHTACLELFSADMRTLGLFTAPTEAAYILCKRIVERLARSSIRTAAIRMLAPRIYDRMESIALATDQPRVRESLRDLCLVGLRSSGSFALSKRLLDRYIAVFPEDPFVENCRAWCAWLWCYEANQHRTARDVFLHSYQRAASEYQALVVNARQPLVKQNAAHALHVIRRKIAEVASGEQTPSAYADIAEFDRFNGSHQCLWEEELRCALESGAQPRTANSGAVIDASAPRAAVPPLLDDDRFPAAMDMLLPELSSLAAVLCNSVLVTLRSTPRR